jgi:hypothetical protein
MREEGIAPLAGVGSERRSDAVSGALDDSPDRVRCAAVRALSNWGKAACVMRRRSGLAAVRRLPLKLAVVDVLFTDAVSDGSTVVAGGMVPHFYETVRRRGCAVGPDFPALAQPPDEALLAELASALSLWSRVAGEWW